MELNEEEYIKFESEIKKRNSISYDDYIKLYKTISKCKVPNICIDMSEDDKANKSEQLRKEGNEAFKIKDFESASILYTRCIASAPNDSRYRGLGFANRSAVLKAMGLYEECIEDIERALANEYPQMLKFKLLVRQAQCYKHLGEKKNATRSLQAAKDCIKNSNLQNNKKEELCMEIDRDFHISCDARMSQFKASYPPPLKLSYGPNKEAPSFSNAVAIEFDEKFGRHLIATRDINTGDVLLVEQPYAAVLCPQLNFSHCNHCMRKCDNLIPCRTCEWVLYCSEKCKEESNKSYHAKECRTASRCMQIIDQNNLQRCLHFVRIIYTYGIENFKKFIINQTGEKIDPRLQGFTNAQYTSSDFNTIYSLTTNITEIPILMIFAACSIAITVSECFEIIDIKNEIASFCLQNILALKNNAHDITHTYLNDTTKIHYELIGGGVYSCASLTNHSCNPNVFRVNYGISNVLRAVRFIKKGEQIFDSYKMHFAFDTTDERQSYLKNHYHFECTCEACIENWPLFDSLPMEITLNDKNIKTLYDTMISATYKCSETSLPVTKSNLNIFTKTINNLSNIQDAKLTQAFQGAQEDVRNYFKSLGNCILCE